MRHPYPAFQGGMPPLRACAILMLSLVLAACGSNSGGQSKPSAPPPVPVQVETVHPKTVDVYSQYPGRVEGRLTVQVVARVEGVLLKRHYTEGQLVHKGDLLYTIDPKPFQATVDQRKAQLASARASLHNSARVWRRTKHLYKVNAVSRADRDSALSNYESDRAAVQQAQANLESAQINLGYTQVKAPITGVTSLRQIDEGSLVQNGTKLTTITQLNPVYVLFALPEDDAIARRKALAQMGNKTSNASTRAATVILPGGKPYPIKGVVDFTQSTINPATGTVQLRAEVKNPNNAMMPGRYVRVRIRLETLDNALVVPDKAISSGQQQTQVFVVVDGKAQPKAVTLGPSVAGGRVISKGLAPGDRVITTGLGVIHPGAPVKIKAGGTSKSDEGATPSKSEVSSAGNNGSESRVASAEVPRRPRTVGSLPLWRQSVAANDIRKH